MDPRLIEVIDFHGRRFGAPVEVVALTGLGSSHVIGDGVDIRYIGGIPADRLTLVGQLGGMVVERLDDNTCITIALAGGFVGRWDGTPGRLRLVPPENIDPDTTLLVWRLLDDDAAVPRGPKELVHGEIAGRALLAAVVGDCFSSDDLRHLDETVEAFTKGDLHALARLAGVPRPRRTVDGEYVRDVLIHAGHKRVPIPRGNPERDVRALHRGVPFRWQIAADVGEILDGRDSARAILLSDPQWTGSAT